MIEIVRRPIVVLAAALLFAISACAAADSGVAIRRSDATPGPASPAAPTDTTEVPIPVDSFPGETIPPDTQPDATSPPPVSIDVNPSDATINFGANKTPQPYDGFLQAALADIQQYWRETYPQVYGSPYTELSGGIYAAYPERTEPIPSCDRQHSTSTYKDVAQGGAFYCGLGDFMAYDDFELVPDFSKRLGNSAVAIVLAHEFGHAIQQRSGVLDRQLNTVFLEQQADCFAGSWAAHVARGESQSLTFGDADVKSGLIAMVEVKDPVQVGATVLDDNAHGSAFDRVGAFQVGFLEGAKRCSELIDAPLPLLDLQFSTQAEVNSGGDLPYADIGQAIELDLTRFWTRTNPSLTAPKVASYSTNGPYPTCDSVDPSAFRKNSVYCSNIDTVVYDEAFARDLYRRFGDFAVGYLIGIAWSDAVQTRIGSTLTGEERALANDCLTGAWTQDTIPANVIDPKIEQLTVSPGDLDEVVATALVMGDQGQNDNIVGSGFEKIASYRAGVLGGIAACGF